MHKGKLESPSARGLSEKVDLPRRIETRALSVEKRQINKLGVDHDFPRSRVFLIRPDEGGRGFGGAGEYKSVRV